MTDGLCVQAVQTIFSYLPRAYADGDDRAAREKMHNAAALAGLGFGNSMASMAHALGHALGALFISPMAVLLVCFCRTPWNLSSLWLKREWQIWHARCIYPGIMMQTWHAV